MSRENVETFRRGVDAFNRHDKAAWLASCDPGLENVPPRDWPESAPVRGSEAVWEFMVEAQQPWEGGSFELDKTIEVADKVVSLVRREMRGTTSGAAVAFDFWVVSTFDNGKLTRIEWFDERAEALEAAGRNE